jgi:hypothetical protein
MPERAAKLIPERSGALSAAIPSPTRTVSRHDVTPCPSSARARGGAGRTHGDGREDVDEDGDPRLLGEHPADGDERERAAGGQRNAAQVEGEAHV